MKTKFVLLRYLYLIVYYYYDKIYFKFITTLKVSQAHGAFRFKTTAKILITVLVLSIYHTTSEAITLRI